MAALKSVAFQAPQFMPGDGCAAVLDVRARDHDVLHASGERTCEHGGSCTIKTETHNQ